MALLGLSGRAFAHGLMSHQVPDAVANRSAALQGPVDPARPMQLQVALPMRHLDKLKDLLAQIYNPESPLYRHYLSVAEFTARFGPTERDYETAARFFAANGLRVTGRAANRYLLQV